MFDLSISLQKGVKIVHCVKEMIERYHPHIGHSALTVAEENHIYKTIS